MVVAALVLVLLSLIWAALALGSEEANTSLRAVFTPSEAPLPAGPGAAPASAEPGGGGGEAITRAVLWLQPFLWAAVLGLLGLLAFARFRGLPDEQAGVAGVAATAAPPAPPAERVRRAYLAVMAAASAPGLGRTANETPQEWAARISGEHPALTGDLAPLTDTYEGVRYGRLPDAAAAADAEAHAERLQARLSELAPAPQVEGDERA